MRTIILLATVVAAAVAIPADSYSSDLDNFNVKEVLENDRLLVNFANCFASAGPCSPDGTDIKKKIPDALKTNCAKCTPKQRSLVREFCQGIKAKHPELLENIIKAHDPNGEYKASFDKFLSSTD